MKRFKVKFQNPDTGKHLATRSYDEKEIIGILSKTISIMRPLAEGRGPVEQMPIPSLSFRIYDRKVIGDTTRDDK